MKTLPDCPWDGCDANNTLEVVWEEMGTKFCVCKCCAKRSRVDERGEVYRCDRRTDVSGNEMFEP